MTAFSSRRRFLRAAAAAVPVTLAGCGGQSTPGQDPTTDRTTTDGSATVALETLVDGLDAPVDVAFVPGSDRRYVAEQRGVVHAHDPDGLRDDPVLDLRDSVVAGGERGLLGIALHPGFTDTRRLFVRYSAPPRNGTPDDYSHTFVLAEFRVSADDRAVRDSERVILEIPEPQANHNAGDVAFGPDGYLYVGVGDGGAGGDQGSGHVADWYDAVGGGNGQDVTENLLGSVLRLDVDTEGRERAYGIPDDNPLVGRDGRDEHYAWGLRNPWGMSFDGDDLYVADVGQNRYEEVNLIEAGSNYGWNVKEGTHCYEARTCPEETPADVRGGEQLVDPIVEYPHSDAPVSGISVIGGAVYRGSGLPALEGEYVFGDLQARGRLFGARPTDGEGLWDTRVIEVAEPDGDKIDQILSFGQDRAGELYVLGLGADGGGVHRLAAPDG